MTKNLNNNNTHRKMLFSNRKSGFIELALLSAVSVLGVFTYQHGKAIGTLQREQSELRSGYVEMKGAINETRTVVNKHEKALQSLGPRASWMEEMK